MSDRKEFQTARDAGLKQRHEQRLARSAHYNEAVKAAAVAIGRAFNGDPLTWRAEAEAAVEAALPHLRAYQIELQTRIGYALGRKEALEEAASWIEDYHGPDPSPANPTWWAGYTEAQRDCARMVRDIGKGDPS